jgi:DNA (cytosine-5)-methyltransferase 1
VNHGSLFSGIGGSELAAEWIGWENKFHCEINPFGRKVLEYYWPESESYEDITKTDFTIWRGKIDILTGGFPCQPYSNSGSRKGKEDERHLWPEMLRAIREIKPRWIVGENVSGIVSWSNGLVFEEIQNDLENQGYEILPILLPALSVGADHVRERVWFIAYSNGMGRKNVQSNFRSSAQSVEDSKRIIKKIKWWKKKSRCLGFIMQYFFTVSRNVRQTPNFRC